MQNKYGRKLICAFENNMRNLENFNRSTWKSWNWDFDGILLSKVRKCMSLKFTGDLFVMHDIEKRCKIRTGIDLSFQNWHEDFDEFWHEHSKISKNCTSIGCLWPKYVMFELKKYSGLLLSKLTWPIWQMLIQALKNL